MALAGWSNSGALGYSRGLYVDGCSAVSDSAAPWTAAHQASLSFTISQSLLKLMSIELVMPFNHLILCHPLLLLLSIFPSIRVFSNESVLRIRWPKYWTLQASCDLEFPKQEYWSGFSFSSPGDLPNPGIEPMFPVPPALQVHSLYAEPLHAERIPS